MVKLFRSSLLVLAVSLSSSEAFVSPRWTRGTLPRATVYATLQQDASPVAALSTDAPLNEVHTRSVSDEIIPVLLDPEHERVPATNNQDGIVDKVLSSYLGPRIILASIAALYATNFALGSIMNDALPASAATSARMVLAATALLPFLFQIKPSLRLRACLCGCCTAMGYITQSIALVDTDPARVSFLGAAVVLWCPFLEWLVDKQPMGWKDAPQTWLSACLCLLGVGILELYNPTGVVMASSWQGDALSLLQAVGFGTGCFLSAKMVREEPDQVLPVTSVLIATTAFLSMLWCLADGWIGSSPDWHSMTLPGMFMDPALRQVAGAVAWTGLISTSFNFVVEISALGRVPSSEASVLLSSEPVWAALIASALLEQTSLGINDYLGGGFIVLACLVNALKPADLLKWFSLPASRVAGEQ